MQVASYGFALPPVASSFVGAPQQHTPLPHNSQQAGIMTVMSPQVAATTSSVAASLFQIVESQRAEISMLREQRAATTNQAALQIGVQSLSGFALDGQSGCKGGGEVPQPDARPHRASAAAAASTAQLTLQTPTESRAVFQGHTEDIQTMRTTDYCMSRLDVLTAVATHQSQHFGAATSSASKKRKAQSPKRDGDEQLRCVSCGTESTPKWRCKKTLCNRCGLKKGSGAKRKQADANGAAAAAPGDVAHQSVSPISTYGEPIGVPLCPAPRPPRPRPCEATIEAKGHSIHKPLAAAPPQLALPVWPQPPSATYPAVGAHANIGMQGTTASPVLAKAKSIVLAEAVSGPRVRVRPLSAQAQPVTAVRAVADSLAPTLSIAPQVSVAIPLAFPCYFTAWHFG